MANSSEDEGGGGDGGRERYTSTCIQVNTQKEVRMEGRCSRGKGEMRF